ncbi:MAG: hypothetical protein QXK47_05895 [Candidatus Bathyarchaeia archaeon]
MKVECPVCGRMGIVEQRGNSIRILHYVGYHDGKRIYERHKVTSLLPAESLRSSGVGLRGFKSHPPHFD